MVDDDKRGKIEAHNLALKNNGMFFRHILSMFERRFSLLANSCVYGIIVWNIKAMCQNNYLTHRFR